MSTMTDMRSRIVETAQDLAQKRGYAGFSYRDIAAAVGIKSASIHYHFPTKDDLVCELLRHYREAFFGQLADDLPPDAGPPEALAAFIGLFRAALIDQDRMCLCGMLAAEVTLLSERGRGEARAFLDQAIAWLADHWRTAGLPGPRAAAIDSFASLEGAMLMSRLTDDPEPFQIVERRILDQL